MHLLAAEPTRIDDGDAALDLAQPPGDIVILSAADTELAALAAAARLRDASAPSLRLANLGKLAHPLSVDLYIEKTASAAKLIVVRMMGGAGYWPYGLDRLRAHARAAGAKLIVVPGEDRWDSALQPYSTVPPEDCRLLWRYLVEGGAENSARALAFCDHLLGRAPTPAPPLVLPHAGVYRPGIGAIPLSDWRGGNRPVAALVFYRALLHGASTAPIDALIDALAGEGIAALPLFVTSLKDRESEALIAEAFATHPPAIVLNTTAFAVSTIGAAHQGTVLDRPGRPVFQVVLAGSSEEAWRESPRGLSPRDLTMNVVLPEVDGRILTRAVSFKEVTPARTTTYRPLADRIRFVAAQAAAWVRLAAKPAADRKVALILSNYPDRDGRIANGVGLDTPESATRLAAAMANAGYTLPNFPPTSADLMVKLLAGPTNSLSSPRRKPGSIDGQGAPVSKMDSGFHRNDEVREEATAAATSPPNLLLEGRSKSQSDVGRGLPAGRPAPVGEKAPPPPRPSGERALRLMSASELGAKGEGAPRLAGEGTAPLARSSRLQSEEAAARPASTVETLPLPTYRAFLSTLPESNRAAITARWGEPESDPFVADGAFRLAVHHRFGNIVVGIQPTRGYSIDPRATYHDPDLVPPHNYLAFYVWLRTAFAADAIIHLGKHGNLEWLPGKALGLADTCWPEIALGPTPLIYPFLVNDPGEGSQAKRRASAVVVDHLMPPMTRAEIHGPLAELETLIDEYYLAAGVDKRRRDYLAAEIVALAERHGLDRDLGFTRDSDGEALRALDAHLCELKEMQIRDGLHILGTSPEGRQRVDTLVAIARVPRTGASPADASLHRAIADDLALGFDPLDCDPAAEWTGPRPPGLAAVSSAPWRTAGDTVERIELHAAELVASLSSSPNAVSLERAPPLPSSPRRKPGSIETADVPSTKMDSGVRRNDEEGNARQANAATAPRTTAVLDWIASDLAPSLDTSGVAEIAAVLAALDGRFVAPGPSGAPTRGRPDVLPTGRNFYSVDVRAVPTAAAWALGRKSADAVALRYFQDEGEWPRSIALSAWGTSNMRTGGDDIAQVLAFLGAEPVWESGTGRVIGFRVMNLSELGRPRIDVTLKISGMFRDAFPVQIDLISSVVRAVSALAEDYASNPVAAAVRAARTELAASGIDDPEMAEVLAATRIFGARPGAYGAGLQALIDTGAWETRRDIAEAFLAWGSFAYGAGKQGEFVRDLFSSRLAAADAILHNQDNREHDILDSDDYYQFQGGLAATVETLKGSAPRLYHGDHSRPEKPVVRSLGEEIARVVRGRAANPKWIAGVMRHGYKGAFEIAATVDYLFAFAATTDAVKDHHFDQLFDAYVADAAVRDFIALNNPPALAEIAARFREAIDRGLWAPRQNSAYDQLSALIAEPREAAE